MASFRAVHQLAVAMLLFTCVAGLTTKEGTEYASNGLRVVKLKHFMPKIAIPNWMFRHAAFDVGPRTEGANAEGSEPVDLDFLGPLREPVYGLAVEPVLVFSASGRAKTGYLRHG
ncbi:hypothetical protein RvY_16168 [Ramazzottius varieornatus]|uniref:Uncharacterized protein n=1 Tax=Ramazzottius varieornatus TaxID=947166 RepID=A0A1D1VXH6_RAMVA|nr:hypothetical protein RvY_16168 [Ramazzottius varieornatus]